MLKWMKYFWKQNTFYLINYNSWHFILLYFAFPWSIFDKIYISLFTLSPLILLLVWTSDSVFIPLLWSKYPSEHFCTSLNHYTVKDLIFLTTYILVASWPKYNRVLGCQKKLRIWSPRRSSDKDIVFPRISN